MGPEVLARRLTAAAWAFATAAVVLALLGIVSLVGEISARDVVGYLLLVSSVSGVVGSLALRHASANVTGSLQSPPVASDEARQVRSPADASRDPLWWLPWFFGAALFLLGLVLDGVGLGFIFGSFGLVVGLLALKATEHVGSTDR